MFNIDERPTIGERYSSATESSNLRVTSRGRGDVDYLIAAGCLGDSLGSLLLRLHTEFEMARGGIDKAREYASHLQVRHADLKKGAADAKKRQDAQTEKKLEEEAKRLAETMKAVVVTERAFALSNMKSLREAKQELFAYADQLATSSRFMEPSSSVAILVGQVLDVYLDPTCACCAGRGFNGGAHRGERKELCRPCRGSGQRRESIGKSKDQAAFGKLLLVEMERITANAATGMKKALQGT